MKTLGQRARERRKELRFSQENVGKHCGVSQEAIRQMEMDELQRPPRYLDELADILQTTKDWLKSGREPKAGIDYAQGGSAASGFGDTGYKGKRAKLSEFLAVWDSATDEEKEQFLAIALTEQKKPENPKK
jgi:transcriptional regulator with XRE-family HTH domain